jgi:hypothetical protein
MKTNRCPLILIATILWVIQIKAQDVQFVTTAKTNSETRTIIITDTFIRNGETNLVRQIRFQNAAVSGGVQKIYHDNLLLGTVLVGKDGKILDISTEPNPKYCLSFDLWHSDKHRIGASIMDTNYSLIDGFNCTNGILIPVKSSQIEKFNQFNDETAEFVKTNSRAGKSDKEFGRQVEDFIEKHKND